MIYKTPHFNGWLIRHMVLLRYLLNVVDMEGKMVAEELGVAIVVVLGEAVLVVAAPECTLMCNWQITAANLLRQG